MSRISSFFPNLSTTGFSITSPSTVTYNCIAWAANEDFRWWWPDLLETSFWPENVPREETISAFVAAFKTRGFSKTSDASLESGKEKVAIYAIGGIPTHMARQLPNGKWTSKLGKLEDIEHELDGLEGEVYGTIMLILERQNGTTNAYTAS